MEFWTSTMENGFSTYVLVYQIDQPTLSIMRIKLDLMLIVDNNLTTARG